ncbi:Uncharacterised protein [Mycobacteroides abscessus subsp. abscessus]|nr:Uncharacterised protein [Mycobacteroides abscessus subsp. abscessus]
MVKTYLTYLPPLLLSLQLQAQPLPNMVTVVFQPIRVHLTCLSKQEFILI